MNKKPIVFPEKSGDYKFVIFKSPSDIYLRLGDIDTRHENIVLDFCKEMDISIKNRQPDKIFHLDNSSGYSVSGGMAQVDLENRLFFHGGFSSAYKIYEFEDVGSIAKLNPDWKFSYSPTL